MSMDRICRLLLSSLILVAVPALAVSHIFYNSAIASSFYPYVFASVIFIHLRLRFSWIDVGGIVVLGLLFAVFDAFVLHPGTVYIVTWVSFLGMGSLAVMGCRAVWLEGEQRRLILLALIPGILILASNHFAGYLHKWTESAHPKALDLYLYSFDSSMRVPIAFLTGQAFEKWKVLADLSFVFYVGLPFTLAVVYAGQARRLRQRAIPIFIAFLIAGPVGGIFYNLFPALGPIHLFAERFPWQPLTTDQARRLLLEPVPLSGLRNAIPSLHMGWTLMAWWYSRGLSIWERSLAFVFMVLTIFATMGPGEHYFVDLVVAFPFILFLQGLFTVSLEWSDSRRLVPLVFGLVTPLVWLWALRFHPQVFWYSPAIPWACCVGTIAAAELARRGMKDAAVGMNEPGRVAPLTAPTAVAELVH
jgi:hypothetical protein